jgi:hypothetical protein
MVFGEHVRAWLSTALGHLLKAILLTPWDGTNKLFTGAISRLQFPLQVQLPGSWANDFEDRRLELLYNLTVNEQGDLVRPLGMRVGQGEAWREHWGWLSHDVTPASALQAVRLAAHLMRSPSLLLALAQGFSTNERYLQLVSLAVFRRWLLTLKTMTWLEAALQHSWEFARPQDLCCFAFNATKPEWPRRVLAISHRSADIKPILIEMKLWQSSRCAIDANYAPSWETNTGMMWGLFSAVPVIARIDSPGYRDSIWCRREKEITDYLAEGCDFRSDRWLLDVPDTQLRGLDAVSVSWTANDDNVSRGLPLTSFPPLCCVWSPGPLPGWEVKLLRAAGALRVMSVFLSDPGLVNQVADHLYTGHLLPPPAPTNNPNGWEAYASIFADLRSILPNLPDRLPIHLPANYSPDDQLVDNLLSERIPDLSTATYDVRDVLVALEWLRTEWPMMVEERRGDFTMINCQELTEELWTQRIELSLLRGLTSVRTPGPIWFLQRAGQTVENWPLVGERPIFTEHVSNQFRWLLEISLDRHDAQSRYPVDSGLELAPELIELCTKGPAAQG